MSYIPPIGDKNGGKLLKAVLKLVERLSGKKGK